MANTGPTFGADVKDESNALSPLLLSLSLRQSNALIRNLGKTFNFDTLRLTSRPYESGSASNKRLA